MRRSRSRMKAGHFIVAAIVCALVCSAATLLYGPRAASAAGDATAVSRGVYLVHNVSMCADCHGTALTGLKQPFNAPSIAGLPQFTSDADAVHFFRTGLLPNGKRARPPMPQYRLNASDASATVAYLRSLKP